MDMESHNGMAAIIHSNFSNNTGNALVWLELHGSYNSVSMIDIQADGNVGFSEQCKDCRGGFFVLDVSIGDCIINISSLKLKSNCYSDVGGVLYISGSVKTELKCFIDSSLFWYNVGRGLGIVIYHSLSNNSHLFTISNCSFKGNTGGDSIIHIEKISSVENTTSMLIIDSSKFPDNIGTAVYVSNVVLLGNGKLLFQNNHADNGAALFLHNSYIVLDISPFDVSFIRNLAYQRGGAIHIAFNVIGYKVFTTCVQSILEI